MAAPHPLYQDQRIALLTQHGKEQAIAPVLEPALGCRIERVSGYDTDQLGTFTREIPRAGTQIEAARQKAKIGMSLSGLPVGLASEGAFGPDPYTGMCPWNVEMLIWIDTTRELEIVGMAEGQATFSHLLTADWAAAEAFAHQCEFPAQQLVVRPGEADDPRLQKDITDWQTLANAFARALGEAENRQVFIETDGRAHANPLRMNVIRRSAENLAQKLNSRCPSCGTPGFWIVERVAGLPCADCGAPTRETRAEIFGCPKCARRIENKRSDRRHADPGRCDYCNP